jgi:hypothetical protein
MARSPSATHSPEEDRAASTRPRRRPWPIHPLLIAGYAVLFLFAENLAEVTLRELIPPLGRALVAAAVVLLVAGLLLRDLRRGAIVATALVATWFGYGHVSGLVVPMGASREVQLVAWAALLVAAIVVATLLRERWIDTLTRALDAIGVALLAIVGFQVARYVATRPASASEPVVTGRATSSEDAPRDIYFLVWDRYGSDPAVAGLGAGPNDLSGWLASRGFYVAPAAHANYGRTVLSLAATLNMRPLDDVVERMGPASDDPTPVHELIQTHAVGSFLKERGYRYVHIGSWFAPTRSVRIADVNLAMTDGSSFEAELEETTIKPALDEVFDVAQPPAHHVLHRSTAFWQLDAFDRVAGEPGPKFVLLHMLLPHEPYVFDETGGYPSKEARDARTEGENYGRQTVFVNDQVRRIVDRLLDGPPERQPIVVIVGDEGPFPVRYAADQESFDWATATSAELETKYGILDAFYLPGSVPDDAPAPYETISSWNTFRVVLGRYFGAELPMLPDRSYASRAWSAPYDLTDVTDRLPAPDVQADPTSV